MPSYTYKMATGDDSIVTIDSVTLFHPVYNNNLNSNPNPIREAPSGVTIAIGRPGNAGGAQGPKTVKGAQSDPNYVSRLLLDCVPVFHKIITHAYLLHRSGPVAIYYSEIYSLLYGSGHTVTSSLLTLFVSLQVLVE